MLPSSSSAKPIPGVTKGRIRVPQKRRSRGIAAQLVLSFLAVGLVPLLITSVIAYRDAASTVYTLAVAELSGLRDSKKDAVQRYFHDRSTDALALGDNPVVISGLRRFTEAFRDGGIDSPAWAPVEAEAGLYLRRYVDQYGYHSTYLIADDGTIVYTTTREADLGASLATGPLSNSKLVSSPEQ